MTEFEQEVLSTLQAMQKNLERLDKNVNSVIEAQKRAQEQQIESLRNLTRGPNFS